MKIKGIIIRQNNLKQLSNKIIKKKEKL